MTEPTTITLTAAEVAVVHTALTVRITDLITEGNLTEADLLDNIIWKLGGTK